ARTGIQVGCGAGRGDEPATVERTAASVRRRYLWLVPLARRELKSGGGLFSAYARGAPGHRMPGGVGFPGAAAGVAISLGAGSARGVVRRVVVGGSLTRVSGMKRGTVEANAVNCGRAHWITTCKCCRVRWNVSSRASCP